MVMGKERNIGSLLTRWYCITAALLFVGLIMQIVPNSTVMVFANAQGKPNIVAYSYFDVMHIGYGNWHFFLSGCLTLASFVLCMVNIWKHNAKIAIICSVLSSLAFLVAGVGSFLFTAVYYLNAMCWITLAILFVAALASFVPFLAMMKK